jgi:hypothetical protein
MDDPVFKWFFIFLNGNKPVLNGCLNGSYGCPILKKYISEEYK